MKMLRPPGLERKTRKLRRADRLVTQHGTYHSACSSTFKPFHAGTRRAPPDSMLRRTDPRALSFFFSRVIAACAPAALSAAGIGCGGVVREGAATSDSGNGEDAETDESSDDGGKGSATPPPAPPNCDSCFCDEPPGCLCQLPPPPPPSPPVFVPLGCALPAADGGRGLDAGPDGAPPLCSACGGGAATFLSGQTVYDGDPLGVCACAGCPPSGTSVQIPSYLNSCQLQQADSGGASRELEVLAGPFEGVTRERVA
jgi:hypothetical protein